MRIKTFGTLLAIALIVGTIGFLAVDNKVGAQTGTSEDLQGFAWSSNIGWVKFQGNTTSGQSYGVKYNPTNGNLTGEAWSSNIGWVRFQPGNYPDDPLSGGGFPANGGDGLASGWTKFLAGGSPQSGGWDGWLKLAKHASDSGASYGVNRSGDKLRGYAWGGDVVGWVWFDPTLPSGTTCPTCGVTIGGLTLTCRADVSATNPLDVTWRATQGGQGTGPYTYCWGEGASGCPAGTFSGVKGDVVAQTQEVDKSYPSGFSTHTGRAQVSDSTGKKAICDPVTVNIGGCPNGRVDDGAGNCICAGGVLENPDGTCPVTPSTGGLTVLSGKVIDIRTQPLGTAAISSVSRIINEGTPASPPIIACVKSIVSRNEPTYTLQTADPDVKCRFERNPGAEAGTFKSCSAATVALNPTETAAPAEVGHFSIKVSRPKRDISTNNPYVVTIGDCTTGSTVAPATVIFDYKVGTFDPL